MHRFLWLILLGLPVAVSAQSPRMLVVDYAMRYPEEIVGAMNVFVEAGFSVEYRQYYPALVEKDALTYDAILLMGGGNPGMSAQETDLALAFVASGKLLILALPANEMYGDPRRTDPGRHDRYMFNETLGRLNIRLYGFAPPAKHGPALIPPLVYETVAGNGYFPVSGMSVQTRAATRLLVGTGAEPLLVEPDTGKVAPKTAETAPPPREQKFRKRRERIRVQPSEAKVDEEVEVLLRGPQTLRAYLHYAARPPAPVPWSTQEFKGKTIAVTTDTLSVRLSGTRWGSDYAIVYVPAALIATTFVEREFTEEIIGDQEAGQTAEIVPLEETGRPAIAAAGRTDRLNKGFVLAIDREVLNTLSAPEAPIGWDVDLVGITEFLSRFGKYARFLVSKPANWAPHEPFSPARIPGQQTPDFPVNRMLLSSTLPERVAISTLPARVSVASTAQNASASRLRGLADYVVRADTRTDSLGQLLPALGMNFFWTFSSAAGLALSDTLGRSETRIESWGANIDHRLKERDVVWYVGIAVSEGPQNEDTRYRPAMDPRAKTLALPSRFDAHHLKDSLFDPARNIARFSRTASSLKGIVVDWDTHLPRPPAGYAMTDVFEDEIFERYIRYVAQNGLYRGEVFKSLQKIERNQRFEWLLKAGRLEEYFEMLEAMAENLGRFYRSDVAEIQPTMQHGSFMRRPRLSWFYTGFWRGVSSPDRPHLLLTYERVPAWYTDFLARQGVFVQTVPIALLGLLPPDRIGATLDAAKDGYCLERGTWLLTDPDAPGNLFAPPEGVTGRQIVETLKNR
ncbi:MAG: hypothetical protein FJY97_04280 [candidate division Zixibacteria bacterium]|nr:hypothetical protein [candidate division Zixibacteria bacterium]